jgi:hypothetical protein
VDIAWKILATLGLVALNGYFVAAEFAAVGARASRLEAEANKGSFLPRLGLEIKKKLDLYLSACQLGVTLASLGLGAVTEPAVVALLEPVLGWLGFHSPAPGQHHLIAFIVALTISRRSMSAGEQRPRTGDLFSDRAPPILAAAGRLHPPAHRLLNSVSNGRSASPGRHHVGRTAGRPHGGGAPPPSWPSRWPRAHRQGARADPQARLSSATEGAADHDAALRSTI